MRIAICPGSFDPVTNGHLDIIRRSAKLFDLLIISVLINRVKNPLFTVDERVELLKRVTGDIPNVKIESFGGLLADYAHKRSACAIVKGLRAVSDFENEFQMALVNHKLNKNVETIFLNTSGEYLFLSSSVVKEIAGLGGDISEFVPQAILPDILAKFR